MTSSERRHAQIVRLFRGEFGENLFDNVGLMGPAGGKVELLSYLALYPNGDLPYTQVVKQSPRRGKAERHLLGLNYPSNAARTVPSGSSAKIGDIVWAIGAGQVRHYGLPVIFVTWMRMLEGNRPKVTLWYASLTEGHWALVLMKRCVRQR